MQSQFGGIKRTMTSKTIIIMLLMSALPLGAQETIEPVLSRDGFNKAAPAVVKLVTDEGRKIGAGVILGVNKEGAGFVLTSYSMIAGRDKLAVIFRSHDDPLLGQVVERWIDFDSDLAVLAVKNFPADQPTITLGEAKSAKSGDVVTAIGHLDSSDWAPLAVKLEPSDDRLFVFGLSTPSGMEGAPLVDDKGNMIALIVSDPLEAEQFRLAKAVKASVIKPILKEWFRPMAMEKKWHESNGGVATWVWAVGGGVLGGTVATAIAVSGGDDSPRGLPRPPQPPSGQ